MMTGAAGCSGGLLSDLTAVRLVRQTTHVKALDIDSRLSSAGALARPFV